MHTDPKFFRYAVSGLISIALAVVLCSLVIIGIGKATTDGVIAIGATAVGALVGIFARPDNQKGNDNQKTNH